MPLPELEVMPGAHSQWLGKQMAHNGMPMSVRMFTYQGTEDDVKKYYQSAFKTKGHGSSNFRNLGEYRVIGYELRGYIYSVQYRQKGDVVEGKLTVSAAPGRFRKNTKSRLPIAPGCKVLSKVESLDFGKRNETLTLSCHKTLHWLHSYYTSNMQSDKWILVANRDGELGYLIDFQRGSETLQINLKQMSHKNKRLVNILISWVRPE